MSQKETRVDVHDTHTQTRARASMVPNFSSEPPMMLSEYAPAAVFRIHGRAALPPRWPERAPLTEPSTSVAS